MKYKILFTLFIGYLGYMIIVLIKLFQGSPLTLVLKSGMIGFISLSLTGCFIILIIEIMDKNQNKVNDNNKNIDDTNQDEQVNEDNQSSDDFSPLNPPHLEVESDSEEADYGS